MSSVTCRLTQRIDLAPLTNQVSLLSTWAQDTMFVGERIYKYTISLSLLSRQQTCPQEPWGLGIRFPASTLSTMSLVIQAKYSAINLNHIIFLTSLSSLLFYRSPDPEVLSPRSFSIHLFLSIYPPLMLDPVIILCQHNSNDLLILSDFSLVPFRI